MSATPRTSSHLVQISRAEQRKQRLLELESEQAAEEAEALKMTEEQRQTLLKPFTSVKVEFTDLDGLRWSQTALRRFPPFHRNTPHLSPTSHVTSKNNTFVVLTNADLANFSAEDTIRVSASTTKIWPRYPGQQATMPHLTTESPRRHRDGSRSRSPIKGLFQPESSQEEGSDSDVLYTEPSDSSDGNVIPVADNGFVAKHKQRVVSRGRRKLVGPPGPMPIDPSMSQAVSTIPRPEFPDSFKERISQRSQASPIIATHDFLSVSTAFAPKDTLYHPPASPILSKSPLIVHSFVAEPPRQVYSPQHARARLHSILNGTMPPRPVPFPVEPDTTPSPFLLSSATFGNDAGQDLVIAGITGDVTGDDETPTASPVTETGGNWIH